MLVSSSFMSLLFPHSLSSMCISFLSAAAGYSGIWGPGGGSGEPGQWKPSTAGQVVPSGRGDPGLPWFSYSSEKWDIPLSSIYFTLLDNGSKFITITCFSFFGIIYLNESEPRSAAESGMAAMSHRQFSSFLTAVNNKITRLFPRSADSDSWLYYCRHVFPRVSDNHYHIL